MKPKNLVLGALLGLTAITVIAATVVESRPGDQTKESSITDGATATSSLKTSNSPECRYSTELDPVEDYARFISDNDPSLGADDGSVTVLEFFDPNCPHCKEIHPIMQDMVAEYGDDVRFFFLPFVLWPYSVPQVEAMYVAAKDGKYFEMLDGMYAMQHGGGLTEEEVRNVATDIGLNADSLITEVMRGRFNQQILNLRQDLIDHGLGGTPTLVINGKFVDPDSKSADCIRELIGDELRAVGDG